MSRSKILFLATFVLIALGVGAQSTKGVVISQRFVPDTVFIGDRFNLEVDITKDLGQEILLPELKDGQLTNEIEMAGMPKLDTLTRQGRQMKIRLTYPLTTFDAGVHSLPSMPVISNEANVRDTITLGDSLRLVVKTFDIDTTTMQIHDIKKPIETPLIWAEIKNVVLLSVLALLIIGAIVFWILRYKPFVRKVKVDPELLIPAHIRAIERLEALDAQKLWQAGRYKEYYSQLTDILRMYVEQRFGICAMEMTTPEIMMALKGYQGDRLSEVLQDADLVKFAKLTPSIEECGEAYQIAYNYVEFTKEIVSQVVEQPTEEQKNK